jgi:hypothetical protein
VAVAVRAALVVVLHPDHQTAAARGLRIMTFTELSTMLYRVSIRRRAHVQEVNHKTV